MAGSLAERLQLVVDATTSGGEAGFARLGAAAKDADTAAKRTGQSVADAADRVAQARAKEADAADAVRVANIRLQELLDKGTASASQIAAATAKVEKAQRQQHLATRDLTQATEAQTRANAEAVAPTEQAGDAAGRMSLDLKGLATTAGGLVGGIALGDWARDAVSGFVDGARAAGMFATSTNSSVAEAGAFLGLVDTLGLSMDDLLEIQAEFAGKTKDGLTQLGTELKHNADGTVNWTNTLVDTIATLQTIPDATERNRLGFSMFGEEGYKQLSRLVASGVDVRDALERVGTPFSEEDVALAAEFDGAMLELGLTSDQLARTIGRAVVPMLVGLVDAGQTVSDVIGAIPGPIGLAAAASIILGFAMRSAGTEGSFLAGAMARASAASSVYTAAIARQGIASATTTAAMGGLKSAASGAAGFLGGPLGLAILGAGAAFYFASKGADDLEAHAHDMAVELAAAEDDAKGVGLTVEQAARKMRAAAGSWETFTATLRGTQITAVTELNGLEQAIVAVGGALNTGAGTRLTEWFSDTDVTAVGFEAAIKRARSELEGFDEQQAVAQLATGGLTDLIAEGATTGREFADAVGAAARAQEDESRTSDLAAAAVEAYNATTRDAVQTTLDLYSAQLGQRDGLIGVQKAFYELSTTVDDGKTPWNEVTEATNQAISTTLNYASASADAAVAAARAAGTVITPLVEAQIRADATIGALRESLNDPNMTSAARAQIEGLIGQLETAKKSGDIEAVVSLLGGPEVAGELDKTTQDRETTVSVESRGGPAVETYLNSIADATRLALVRVESRNGPAVLEYLRGLVDSQRLAIINVESRGGPAVDGYLDSIAAQDRLSIIRVETRGGPDVDRYLDSLASTRTALINVGRGAGAPATGSGAPMLRGAPAVGAYADSRVGVGSVTLDLELTGSIERGQLSRAERGRAHIQDIRAYERENGTGWRKT